MFALCKSTCRICLSPRRNALGLAVALLALVWLGSASHVEASSVYASRLRLTWSDPNNNEIGIKIERANTAGGPWNQIAQLLPNATSYRDTGLVPNTTYYYRARAYNAAGDSGYSNVASNRTPTLNSASIITWGLNDSNQATPPAGVAGVLAIESGASHSLALKSDGTVVAWGLNTSGQASVPAGLSGVVAIAAGGNHSLALKSDGTVVAWGLNVNGQASVPAGLSKVVAIAGGGSHSLALKSDGTVVAWGLNANGQTTVPAGLSGVVVIAAGGSHSLALKSDGMVVAWGLNTSGQTTVPTGLTGVADIAAGGNHSLALKSNGTVVGWGLNANGQATVPGGLSGVVDIAAGTSHSLAIRNNGAVVTWGLNTSGQTSLPAGMTGAVAISGGGTHSVALVTDCFYGLTTGSINVAGAAGSGSVGITAPSGCAWTANAGAGWLHTTSAGTGKGTVNFTVDANPGSARSGAITIQGQTFTVNQAGSCSYTINTSSAPSSGGSTSGDGAVACGAAVTVTATANAGYSFSNWTEGGTPVSTAASYTFAASANRSLVANFSATTYTINTSATPSAGGSTSGGGNQTAGTSVTVTATANAGYSFSNWTENGTPVSTAASYTFATSANRSLVANFSATTYTINTSATPSAGGSTSGGGNQTAGTSVTVTATATAGYSFSNWTEGGTPVSTAASYTFTASAGRTLVANFNSDAAGVLPTVTNALLRTENTAVVVAGETNVFAVVASFMSGGQPLNYAWNFGDGTSRSRSPVSTAAHIYPAACGAYAASVTIDNGLATVTTVFTVSVACQLTITKLQARLNFAKVAADRASFEGTLDLPADYQCAGKVLTLNLGGAQVSSTLDRQGRGVSQQHSCRLKFNQRTGLWVITGKLRNGSWQNEWSVTGLVNADTAAPVTLTTVVLLDHESFAGEQTLNYTATRGAAGLAQ